MEKSSKNYNKGNSCLPVDELCVATKLERRGPLWRVWLLGQQFLVLGIRYLVFGSIPWFICKLP